MKEKLFTIIFLFSLIVSLFPEEVYTDLLSRPGNDYPLANTVRWEGNTVHNLQLLPDLPEAVGIRERFRSYRPEITVERFYKLALPKQYLPDKDPGHRMLFTTIMNAFGSPGTQVGYTYHSETRGKDISLFKKSYISDKKGRKRKGFTFNPESLPERFNYYQYIDEVNFSGTVFEQKIEYSEGSLIYHSTNLGKVRFLIFPVMSNEGTRNEVLIFVHGNSIFAYNCTQVKNKPPAKILGFSIQLSSMFRKRMDLMIEWLEDRIWLSVK